MSHTSDEAAVAACVASERHWRDTGRWDLMAAAYDPDCDVRLAWFHGKTAAFLEASRRGGRGGSTRHRLSPSVVTVHGDRAVAETAAVVETRTEHEGVPVDLFSYGRYLNRLTRGGGVWRLRSVDFVCEKDTLHPVYLGDTLAVDAQSLGRYRPSYRFLGYTMEVRGTGAPPDLPGDDEPGPRDALYETTQAWLAAADAPLGPTQPDRGAAAAHDLLRSNR